MKLHAFAFAVFLPAFLALAPSTVAQQTPRVQFTADLDGSKVVPPNPSTAVGLGEFVLDLTTKRFTFRVITTCVGPVPELMIGIGPPGQNGPILFTIPSFYPSDMYEGVSPVLTDGQVTTLLKSGMYAHITANFPFSGLPEIRGQIEPSVRRHFESTLDGASVVPATGSAATANARILVDVNARLVTLDVEVAGLSPSASASVVELHTGAPGQNGPMFTAIAGGPTHWSGTTDPIAPADLAALLAGNAYLTIPTIFFMNGEIRGPIVPKAVERFVAELSGAGLVPNVPTGASGLGRFSLDVATSTLVYDITVSGMTATTAQINFGVFGEAPTTFSILPGSGPPWRGTTGPLAPADLDKLFQQGIHVSVASAAFPSGEVRGQLVPNPMAYGFGSDSGWGRLRIGTAGEPVLGDNTFAITATGAVPNVPIFLLAGFGNAQFGGAPLPIDLGTGVGPLRSYLWMDFTGGLILLAGVADAQGSMKVLQPIPALPALLGYAIYDQWVDLAGASVVNVSVSDALKFVIQ